MKPVNLLPQCANEIDDDLDMLIDYPNDIGCRAAFDDDETDERGQGVPDIISQSIPISLLGTVHLMGRAQKTWDNVAALALSKCYVMTTQVMPNSVLNFIEPMALLKLRICMLEFGNVVKATMNLVAATGEPIELVEDDEESMISPEAYCMVTS